MPQTNWLNDIIRKEILEFKSYSSARDECKTKADIQLDANESPYPCYGDLNSNYNRYPNPQPKDLKNKLASIYERNPEELLITRGMDEGIDLLIKIFCKPYQDSITILPTTFGFYEVSASINAIKTNKIPLTENFEPNWKELEKLDDKCKIIFLCSPNNPSGNLLNLKDIENLCNFYKNKKIIAVDEAYLEFSNGKSASTLLNKYENLIVMKTLSKAYALAGLRLGCLIAKPQIITVLKKVLAPYPIGQATIDIALKSLSTVGLLYTKEKIKITIEEREYLIKKFKKSKLFKNVYPSQANFILVTAENSDEIYNNLAKHGIIIRNRNKEIPNALRITVGSPEENKILLKTLNILENTSKDFIETIRESTINRITNETEVLCEIKLDNKGFSQIETGLNFFNHMLEQIAKHSGISLKILAKGDIEIDNHHTIEDVAIVLGAALKKALGNKRGINRYGFLLPMDDAQAQVSLDLSGRAYCSFNYPYNNKVIGDISVEMIKHFFETLSNQLSITLHINVTGENNHHMVEAIFKSFAKALKQAITIVNQELPSTKGSL